MRPRLPLPSRATLLGGAISRATLLGGAIALILLVAPRASGAQQQLTRFFVDSVADSTFVFRTGGARWIRPGQVGIAVDPGERDALVARFRVVGVTGSRAVALITGQTTFVTGDHVALLEEPRSPFWRRPLFWTGSLVGAALGLVAGLAF